MHRPTESPRPGRRRTPLGALGPLAAALGLGLGSSLTSCGAGAESGPTATDPTRGLVILPADDLQPSPEALARGLDPLERTSFHDFGQVPLGDEVSHTYHLYNASSEEIVIEKLVPSCGCVTLGELVWTGRDGVRHEGQNTRSGDLIRVPPGETLLMTLDVDSVHVRNRNLDKLTATRLSTSSTVTPWVTVEMHLVVIHPFDPHPDVIDMGRVPRNGPGHGSTVVLSDPLCPVEALIVEPVDLPEDVVLEWHHEMKFGKHHWFLDATLLAPQELGLQQRVLRFRTETPEGEPGPPCEVPLRAHIVPDLEFSPTRLFLREMGSAEATLTAHLPGQRLRILRAEVRGDQAEHFRVEYDPIDPDVEGRSATWTLRLERISETAGPQAHGTILLDLDDPQTPRLELVYDSFI